jgi:SAM-dependent methyltransferase
MTGSADPAAELEETWRLVDSEPDALAPKQRLSRLLRDHPQLAVPGRRAHLVRLLADPDLDPVPLAAAGWSLLLRDSPPPWRPELLEGDSLALRLLEQAYVTVAEAEAALTALRRELLLSGRWDRHPRLARALVRQARHNGGAWWFGEDERERLGAAGDFASAYLPPRPPMPDTPAGPGVAAAVAEQYRAWPYPPWTRIDAPGPTTLPDALEPSDPGGPPLPVQARVLVAGCGTGREPAILARRFPDARITAIDISETSLAYAAERCRGLGITFRRLDLHRAAELGQFDLISSSGVLHHLADPEAGWAALTAALRPGGVIRLMLYSRLARLRVRAARSRIADLVDRPVTDDLLREAAAAHRRGSASARPIAGFLHAGRGARPPPPPPRGSVRRAANPPGNRTARPLADRVRPAHRRSPRPLPPRASRRSFVPRLRILGGAREVRAVPVRGDVRILVPQASLTRAARPPGGYSG